MKSGLSNKYLDRSSIRWILLQVVLIGFVAVSYSWTPPVGIPDPPFGITNTHWMYTNSGCTFDFGAGPVPYPVTTNGPYTHYIDITDPAATDSANPFGSPSKPRKTWPFVLPAGSVVEVHGGPYNFRNFYDKMGINARGTAEKPVFFRGAGANSRPHLGKGMLVFGEYAIVEHIESPSTLGFRLDLASGGIQNISIRFVEMYGRGTELGNAAPIYGIGNWTPIGNNNFVASNIVVYGNRIHDYGDRDPGVEADWVGVVVNGFAATDVWILDNEIYHMGGDSVRIGSNASKSGYTTRRVYVGRNRMYDNGENALDIKGLYDVVVSENEMHGFAPSTSDPGAAIVVHYGCTNIWLIANRIYEAAAGLSCSDAGDVYVVGNVFSDVGDGAIYWSGNQIHFVNNTFDRFNNGIKDIGGSSLPHPVINNIFCGLKDITAGFHIRVATTTAAANSAMRNNLIFNPDGKVRIFWGGIGYSSLESFVAGSGKGTGCLASDPQFSGSQRYDYSLKSSSPARDAGMDITYYRDLFSSRFGTRMHLDIAGTERPQGDSWDIGAHEVSMAPANLRVVPDP